MYPVLICQVYLCHNLFFTYANLGALVSMIAPYLSPVLKEHRQKRKKAVFQKVLFM